MFQGFTKIIRKSLGSIPYTLPELLQCCSLSYWNYRFFVPTNRRDPCESATLHADGWVKGDHVKQIFHALRIHESNHLLRMVSWNLNTLLRRWLYTPIIIWQGDWILRDDVLKSVFFLFLLPLISEKDGQVKKLGDSWKNVKSKFEIIFETPRKLQHTPKAHPRQSP